MRRNVKLIFNNPKENEILLRKIYKKYDVYMDTFIGGRLESVSFTLTAIDDIWWLMYTLNVQTLRFVLDDLFDMYIYVED